MFGIDAVIAIGGLLIPPAVDFIKKKFLPKGADSPEATMSTLATTKPDTLGPYVESLSKYLDAQTKFFNRDVSGCPSQWVVNLRAAIRPCGVIAAFMILSGMLIATSNGWVPAQENVETIAGVRFSCEAIISSWFGDRLSISR